MNRDYIIKKQTTSNRFKISEIEVWVKDELPKNVSAKRVIKSLFKIIPKKLMSNVKFIHVGNFSELKDRKIQALYRKSTILVTNEQSSEEDLLDDLVHEVAHSVEEIYNSRIYSDKKIESEFLMKRKDLWVRLKREGFDLDLKYFLNTSYKESFDFFLHQEVGYNLLSSISRDLFYSPYAATSVREYFANGFEAFFLKEQLNLLKSVSPNLFKKLSQLM